MTLFDQGWTEEHAKGLLDCLRLTGGVPHWKAEHLRKLQEWCSAHGKDYKSIEGQLDFVAYELRNAHQDIGMALRRAKTVEEARSAAEPYVKDLRRAGMVPGIQPPSRQRQAAMTLRRSVTG